MVSESAIRKAVEKVNLLYLFVVVGLFAGFVGDAFFGLGFLSIGWY